MNRMNFREELAKRAPRLRNGNTGKIYVFGIGEHWRKKHTLYNDVVDIDLTDYITAFVDNDPNKQGLMHMGLPVIAPVEIDTENAVVLVSTWEYEREVIQQLSELGFVNRSSCFDSYYFDIILRAFVCTEIRKFSKSVQGGRCFILGNAPSLRVDDLDVLHRNNETTFAFNNIYKIFNQVRWRPTYYILQDYRAMPDVDTLKSMQMPKFIALYLAKNELFDKSVFYFDLDMSMWYGDPTCKVQFSTEIERMYDGGSVVYSAIQAAVNMGYDEIYLLGVDNKYPIEVLYDGTIIKNVVNTYFYSDVNPGPGTNPGISELARNSLKCARDYSDRHGISIYNATRGGALEVFKRVDFDSLFLH